MKIGKSKKEDGLKKSRRTRILMVTCLLGLVLFPLSPRLKETTVTINLRQRAHQFFEPRLFIRGTTKSADIFKSSDINQSAIYVLGGTQESLRLKFREAAGLYLAGLAQSIMVLHSIRLTEFNPEVCRNLTENEWSIQQLTNLGVKRQDIMFIEIEPGLFGTLSEAKTIANVIARKGIRNLLLVCSSYHGRRVWETFSAIVQEQGLQIGVYGVDEPMRIMVLLIEYGKLLMYKHFLIPYEVRCVRQRAGVPPVEQIYQVDWKAAI